MERWCMERNNTSKDINTFLASNSYLLNVLLSKINSHSIRVYFYLFSVP